VATVTGGTAWRAGRLTAGRGERLVFGHTYEDPRVELAAFPPGCRVLAIASAGDTVAALAAAGHRVTAVDLNPVQLRYAAARLAGAPSRRGQAERLLAAGRNLLRTVAPAWRPARLAPFLRLTDPADQLSWWDEQLDRSALRLLLRPLRHAALVVRPGLAAAVPDRFDVLLRDRLRACLSRHPNATNPYLRRLVLGRHPGDPDRPGGASAGVRFVWADVVDQLRAGPAGRYDAVTLSNVADGTTVHFRRGLVAALRHGMRPGGPVVLRGFGAAVPLDADLGWQDRTGVDRCPLWGTVSVGAVR
jgi:S-adenosylmethionine:diacylglycerol 3-amino-3-carboxypropyl transferase